MYNSVQLIGFTGSDPDTKLLDNGSKIANFSLATTERYKDNNGDVQKKTTWHRITAFSPIADVIEKHLRKGAKIFIQGRLNYRKWTNRDGHEKDTTEIVVEKFVMLGGRKQQYNQDDSTDD